MIIVIYLFFIIDRFDKFMNIFVEKYIWQNKTSSMIIRKLIWIVQREELDKKFWLEIKVKK